VAQTSPGLLRATAVLQMSHDQPPWLEDLAAMLDLAWQRILRGALDRKAAARHPTLATVSKEEWQPVTDARNLSGSINGLEVVLGLSLDFVFQPHYQRL